MKNPKSYEEWENLYRKDREEWLEKYKEFMYDNSNCGFCENCPENKGMEGNGQLPCGQFRCWVDIHCQSLEDKQEEV